MTVQAPIADYAAARTAMVDSQLRPQGVTDRAVLAAMAAVAREDFLPDDLRPLAYADRSLALGEGGSLPAPAVLGQLLTQIAPQPGEKALVVGAGNGYSAAVLTHIGCEVSVLDVTKDEAGSAPQTGAAYDIILIEGAVDAIPEAFINQLADGGRLGGGLADRGVTRLIVGRKVGTAFGHFSIGDSGIAPLPGFSRPREFSF